MRTGAKTILLAGAVALLACLPVEAANALRSDVLYLLPKESGEVAFLDLQVLRSSPHYSLVKRRMVPPRFGVIKRLLEPAGMDMDRDLDWVAWVRVPPSQDQPTELFIGIAQGHFLPDNVRQYFLAKQLPLDSYRGQTLYPAGRGQGAHRVFFAFLDSSTAVFGDRAGLELMLETRYGAYENLLENEKLHDRIQRMNGRAAVWAAWGEYYTRQAIRQLFPEAAKFEQFRKLSEKFRASALNLDVGRDVEVIFRAWTAASSDAQVFSMLLQTGLMAQSWQARNNDPVLSEVFRQAQVSTAGNHLEVQVNIPEENVQALLERRRLP